MANQITKQTVPISILPPGFYHKLSIKSITFHAVIKSITFHIIFITFTYCRNIIFSVNFSHQWTILLKEV